MVIRDHGLCVFLNLEKKSFAFAQGGVSGVESFISTEEQLQ